MDHSVLPPHNMLQKQALTICFQVHKTTESQSTWGLKLPLETICLDPPAPSGQITAGCSGLSLARFLMSSRMEDYATVDEVCLYIQTSPFI